MKKKTETRSKSVPRGSDVVVRMDEVRDFPTRAAREWFVIEREIKAHLAQFNVPPAVEKRLIITMKAFYAVIDESLGFKFDVPFPVSPEQAEVLTSTMRTAFAESIHEFTNKLYFERLLREIDVCKELGLF